MYTKCTPDFCLYIHTQTNHFHDLIKQHVCTLLPTLVMIKACQLQFNDRSNNWMCNLMCVWSRHTNIGLLLSRRTQPSSLFSYITQLSLFLPTPPQFLCSPPFILFDCRQIIWMDDDDDDGEDDRIDQLCVCVCVCVCSKCVFVCAFVFDWRINWF